MAGPSRFAPLPASSSVGALQSPKIGSRQRRARISKLFPHEAMTCSAGVKVVGESAWLARACRRRNRSRGLAPTGTGMGCGHRGAAFAEG